MDRRLRDAAFGGDVKALNDLLQEDRRLLHNIDPLRDGDTPLHIASRLGHVDFTARVLEICPELAERPDEQGFYPIHLAASHGRIGVLEKLLRFKTALSRRKSRRGETPLQLCLKTNQLEAAKVLVKFDEDLVNVVKDSQGNTVLHLATFGRQLQMLKLFLRSTRVEVNAENKFGHTALDVLAQRPSECGDMEIHDLLSSNGCKRNQKRRTTSQIGGLSSSNALSWKEMWMSWPFWKQGLTPSSWFQRQKKDKDWFKEKHNTLLIVATLIATVTFTAGLSPPGGIWQDPSAPVSNKPGKAISEDDPKNFKFFMYFDMSGLVSSLFIILFLVSGLPLKNDLTTWVLVITMWVAVTSVTMAFVYGTRLVVISDKIANKLFWVLVAWSGFMGLLLCWHFIVALFHLIHLCLKVLPFWPRADASERVSGERKPPDDAGQQV